MPACSLSCRTRSRPAHRHSQSALRFVLEGKGAYTAVDGERTLMHPGDFIITPYMAWHDHGNDTDEPMFWLDGLDIPLIQFLDASFVERLDEDEQPIGKPEGYSMARYGANLLPVDQNGALRPPRRSSTTPMTARARRCISWPRRRSPTPATASRCATPIRSPAITPCRPWAPSSSCCRRASTRRAIGPRMPRCSCAMEGTGARASARPRSSGVPKDIFVVPSWKPVTHEADEETVLFSFSDRPVQEKIGVWREDRGNA